MSLKTAQEAGKHSKQGAGRKGKLVRTESIVSRVSETCPGIRRAGRDRGPRRIEIQTEASHSSAT